MSLFKISKGDSSRIGTDVTPFEEGRVYFTADDGGLYIDSRNGEIDERVRVRTFSSCVYVTLNASDWVNGQQTLIIGEVSTNTNGLIGVSEDVTNDQLMAAKNAELRISGQSAGRLTVTADGDVPEIDIPCVLVLFDSAGSSTGGSGGVEVIEGPQGEPGYTPIRGVDYWTNADKTQIVNDTKNAMPAWTRANTKPTYTASEVGALPLIGSHDIDTYLVFNKNFSMLQEGETDGVRIEILQRQNGYPASIDFYDTIDDEPVWLNNLETPISDNQAATKGYVDTEINAITATDVGAVPLSQNGVVYDDVAFDGRFHVYSQNESVGVTFEAQAQQGFFDTTLWILGENGTFVNLRGIADPITSYDAVNKDYVDNLFNSIVNGNGVSY